MGLEKGLEEYGMELSSAFVWPRASARLSGPLGEMRAALAESEHWTGQGGWTDRQHLLPAQTARLVPLWAVPVPEPGLSQSTSGSGKCWG